MVSHLSGPARIIEVDTEHIFRKISDANVISRADFNTNIRHLQHGVDVFSERQDATAQNFISLSEKLNLKIM